MLIPHIFPLALLACSASAKPVSRPSLPKRQFTNSSILGITQTSTETAPSTTSEAQAVCQHTYTTSEDNENCGEIATMYRIRLSQFEANHPSASNDCREILRAYGICYEESSANETNEDALIIDISMAPISSFNSSPSASPQATIIAGSTATGNQSIGNIVSNSSNVVIAAGTLERVVTRLITTTLSYTLGTAGATVRTVVLTRTYTEVEEFTSTVTVDATPCTTTSSSAAGAGDGFLVTAPTPGSTCLPAAPPIIAITNGVVAGCTRWYTAIPGDFCYKIAQQFGIPVTLFMDWNPTINAPWCTNLFAGKAYCVATCDNPGNADGSSFATSIPPPTPAFPAVSSPTLPAGVTSLPASPTLPAGVTSLPPSPTLPAGVSSLPQSPTLPAGVTSVPAVSAPPAETPTVSSSTLPASIPPTDEPTDSQPATSAPTSGTDVYKAYLGDGSVAAGWPTIQQWIPFDSMFEQNRPNMLVSCQQWGVPDDSDEEISHLKDAITTTSSASGIDARFILAITMQESQGCVRVITTAYSHPNPGLMQTHNGTGTCNTNMAPLGIPGVADNGMVQTPCPQSEIMTMIKEGTQGTTQGDGLVQLFQQQGDSGAQGYYRTARLYNGGSIDASGLLEQGCCTSSYASDVANRLTGWVKAPRDFSG